MDEPEPVRLLPQAKFLRGGDKLILVRRRYSLDRCVKQGRAEEPRRERQDKRGSAGAAGESVIFQSTHLKRNA
jgi:hypothetical protein